MNIVLLTRSLGFGGAERQLVHLANGLALRGHQVTVATLYPGAELEAELRGPNPALLALNKRGRWDLAGFLWRLPRRLRSLRPDVIYAFLPVPNLLAALAGTTTCRGAAVVWGIRGTPLDLAEYDWLARLAARVERWAAGAADFVIANSAAGAGWARAAGLPPGRVAVIANGIDTGAIRPAGPAARLAAREALGCRADAVVVAVVARLDPMKDHSTFLRAFAVAAVDNPRLLALVVGDGPPAFAAGLRAEAEALGLAGRVVWAGARRDVATVYHAADLLCLPSAFGEGFPNVLGEAMAAGLRCIATAVGDSAEIVGPYGRVVPPRDAPALAAAILDEAGHAGQVTSFTIAVRQRVIDRFSIERMVASTEAVLTQAVSSRRQEPR